MDKMKLDKFDGQNYTSWKFQLDLALAAKGLTGYVNGSIIKPEPTLTDNKSVAIAAWIQEDARAMLLIAQNVVDNLKPLLFGSTTSKDMMTKLETTYAIKSQVTKQST